MRACLLAAVAGLLTVACSSASLPQGPPLSEPTSPTITPPDSPGPSPTPTASSSPQPGKPLAGEVIGIDPGHNGLNGSDPAYINRIIWNGRENETCDTTGTQTAAGYTEARFNFNVATYLRADLEAAGARVVMTRQNNHGVGPCVNRRARILDDAHVAVAIDIHADGGPESGRGFTVLEPVADGVNGKVIASSDRFGRDVKAAMLRYTPMPESDYYGSNGFEPRDDLAGLNLTTVPKVLLESGNMINPTDAAILTTSRFQREEARALVEAMLKFLKR